MIHLVQGTPAEKYLQEQIDYVNQARGIDPASESPKKVKLENIPSALDTQKAREAQEAEKKAAKNNKQPVSQA